MIIKHIGGIQHIPCLLDSLGMAQWLKIGHLWCIANKNCNLFFPNWQVTPLLSTPCRFFHHLLRVFHLES